MSRGLAASLTHTTCPRCGSQRASTQVYCVECGLRLPVVVGAVARLRLAWVRRLGWYPGDWFWGALLCLVLAAAGATASIVVNRHHQVSAAATIVAGSLPAQPEASGLRGANGAATWPARLDGWTVVLQSTPAAKGSKGPQAAAHAAARHGLQGVGVLDSSQFGSLHPGYLVVFSGVYGASGDAALALREAQDRGYGAAYVVRVAR